MSAEPIVDVESPRRTGRGLWHQRARTWTAILSAYFGTQTIAQLTGIAAGLLLVRNMTVHDFALYTLATSVITFFAFATDLGSSTSLVHFYRQSGGVADEFARYLAAVLSMRRAAFVVGAVVVAVVLPTAARARGFEPAAIGLTTAAVVAAVGFQIVASLRQLALRLDGAFARSYRADLAGAAARLVLVAFMVWSALLSSWVGVAVAAAASAITWAMAGKKAMTPTTPIPSSLPIAAYRRAVVRYMLPTLPSALYFAAQAPLVVWLAATFGGARNIAQVGALTRLGLLVGIFSGLTGTVFLPRLARVHDERLYRARVLQFGSVHVLVASALVLCAWAAPEAFLWVLGPHYTGLHRELLLVVLGSGLTLLDGYLVSVNLARSWTRWQGLGLAALVSAQVLFVATLPMTTSAGVLRFNVASAAVALLGQAVTLAIGFVRPRWVVWNAAAAPAPVPAAG